MARHFESYLAQRGVDAVAAESWVVEEFLAESDVAASTKRAWHAHLRAAYRYAKRRKLVETPCDHPHDLVPGQTVFPDNYGG